MKKTWILALSGIPVAFAARGAQHAALFVGMASSGDQVAFAVAPAVEPSAEKLDLVETRRIVPSVGLPPEVSPMPANNNLDVVRHSDGRVYLAFRSAPTHFAGRDTAIFVVSSEDERTWDFEARLSVGTDLREPRLLSFGGRLFLYVSKLGDSPLAFEPSGAWVSERTRDAAGARWTPLESLDLPEHVVWRTKVAFGRAWMSAYQGGGNIYRFNGQPLRVSLFESDDGRHWAPADPGRPYVYEGGVSEAEFEFGADRTLFAVGRNEVGDAVNGFGSVVCSAPPDAPARWACHRDPRKYDSPLMFSHRGEVYLVARRTASEGGAYDLGLGWGALRGVANALDYVTTGKRCSVFHYVKAEGRLAFVMDLPSRGDTCFPGFLQGRDQDEVILYNYSSDIDGPDVAWSVGQRRPTYIYRHVLRFTNEASAAEPRSNASPEERRPAARPQHG
ncbi:MAG: hypothetical protein JOZ69_20480 [Myxococcales bacterium]|nr:hypothetical protein [Myxococcales bacterium]